jgi:hypothetical protein
MVFLGAVGLGAVWGWILGFWNGWGRGRRVWLNATVSALATLPLAALSQVFGGWRGVLAFAIAAVLALIFHLAWLARLRAQSRT